VRARRWWAWPLAPVYAAALMVKDTLRRVGLSPTRRLAWPVMSVGSLSAGGAGKTPVVIALAELLQERGWVVDVLSRGYGRSGSGVERVDVEATDAAGRFGDEPVLIARRTGVPVWVGSDRFEAGRRAEAVLEDEQEAGSSAALRNDKSKRVHLLDDGFQHRRLARAMDVVLVTAEDLEDALLPAGNRREPLATLRRADGLVVREEEWLPLDSRLHRNIREDALMWAIRRQVSFPEIKPVLSADVPTYGYIVFSAIARPADFIRDLTKAGVGVLEAMAFPDHHAYTVEDMNRLVDLSDLWVGNAFVTTEKDAVKLSPAMRAQLEAVGPLVVARLDCFFVDPAEVIRAVEARIA
jgi:tetraacyldisaccharide 4'-kinase